MTEAVARTSLPGKRLRAAREAQGLSEAEVARRLHMSVTFVRAIEADDYDRLPEATFIKGYLRNYARLLNVPADEVANLFSQLVADEVLPGAEETAAATSGSKLSPLVMAVAVLMVVALVWWFWPSQEPQSPSMEPSTETSTVEQGSDGTMLPPLAEMAEPEQATGAEPLDDTAAAQSAVVEVPETVPAIEQDMGSQVSPSSAAAQDQVRISFNAPCWVQVKDGAGEVLYAGNKDAGNDLVLGAAGPFRFTFGNGAAVSALTINGQSFTVPASVPGKVVRFRAP